MNARRQQTLDDESSCSLKYPLLKPVIMNSNLSIFYGLLLTILPLSVDGFSVVAPNRIKQQLQHARVSMILPPAHACKPHWDRHSHLQMTPWDFDTASTFLLSGVEVFDGSSIVDPVVVSSSFWNSLQRQILSVVIGNILAAVVFGLLASFFASQLSNIRDYFMTNVVSSFMNNDGKTDSGVNNNNNNINNSNKPFVKADSPQYKAQPDFGKLLICLAIDVVGSSSELLPIVGEFTDLLTAPISATLLQNLFGSNKILFFFELLEEILPFTE
jgi:hypothetical protein